MLFTTNHVPHFRSVICFSIFIRVVLILYSEWHDAHSVLKYTDIDYQVFSDATRFLLHPTSDNHARGWLGRVVNLGDPYTRETYRYTPLLAILLAPNEWVHPSFGKYLFAGCDIVNGMLIYRLLVTVILPRSSKDHKSGQVPSTLVPHATLYASLYLLNPLIIGISTRGSSESVLSLFVLGTLYAVLRDKWVTAAVWLGVATHWKIYPVIYGVSCLGVVSEGKTLVCWKTLKFTLISAGTFVGLGITCYSIWGMPFLSESYLYHLHRLDHRHNFSPYFYLIYLTYPPLEASCALADIPFWRKVLRSPLTSFMPQMVLSLGTGFLFGRKQDLVFTWFVQTVTFVIFNKVCTSQYFIWYLVLLPLLLPQLSISWSTTCKYLAIWLGTQVLWLSEAYKLEFLGSNVFYGLWVRSLVYVLGNGWVLVGVMNGYASGC